MFVKNFYNKNQFIIQNDEGDEIVFQSYESKIANFNKKEKKLYVFSGWDYSKTTLKHFYLFLSDYVYEVYEILENKTNMKKYFNDHMLNSVVNDIEIIKSF